MDLWQSIRRKSASQATLRLLNLYRAQYKRLTRGDRLSRNNLGVWDSFHCELGGELEFIVYYTLYRL